jgi:hypothetical protein
VNLLPPPGPGRRRQLILLALLLVGTATFVWYRFSPPAPETTATASRPIAPTPGPLGALPEAIKLADLKAVPEGSDPGRNPFGFGERPAPPPPPRAYVPPPVVMPVAAPLPAVPQGPPPIPLKLAGLVIAEAGRTMVTLKDPTSDGLFQAFEGDIVDGRYRVVKIGAQSVVISYLDGTGTRTLQLGG